MPPQAARMFKAAREPGLKARSVAAALARGLRPSVLALAFLLVAACAGGEVRADPVRGEASLSTETGYARLVLKFSEDVPTDAVVAGSILVVQFKKPVDLPVDLLSGAAPSYVSMIRRDPDGTALRMALAQKLRVNMMTAGERIFIDLLPEKWTGPPPALPAEVVKELSDRAIAAERALRLQKQADEIKKRPPIRVHASLQPTFVRLVFGLPDGVAVSSSLGSDKFTLYFNSALTFDLADAKIVMPPNIQAIDQKIEGDTSRVDISLIGEVDVHAFREEKSYVVDVGFKQAQKLPQAALQQAPNAKAARNASPGDGSGDPTPPTSEEIARESKPDVKTAGSGSTDAKQQDAQPVEKQDGGAFAPPPAAAEVKPAAEARPVPPARAEAAPSKDVPPSTAMAAQPAAPQPSAPAVQAPAQAPARIEPAPVGSAAKVTPEIRRVSDGAWITFPFSTPTAAAVFRRADSLWMVFDTDAALDVDQIQRDSGPIVAGVAAVDLPNGRALRIRLSRPQFVSLTGDERAWTLVIADKIEAQTQPLTAMRNKGEPERANVSIALSKPGRLHRFVDPDAGDLLMVMTLGTPVCGFTKRQDFVEFSLLESIHGVVIEPKADDVTATVVSDKLILTRPDGLTLSSGMMTSRRSFSAVRTMFDINEWRENQKAEFVPAWNKLMAAAALSTGDLRMPAHLKLARFYLSRGFYPEAKGVLDLVVSDMKPDADEPSVIVLHAIAASLAGRPEVALTDLANPLVGGNFDSQLWKALAYAQQEKWPDAREKFKNVDFSIAAQPIDLQRILLAAGFRASLEVGDYPGAEGYSNDLDVIGLGPDQEGQVTVLRGRLAEALGRDKDALAEFRSAASSRDRLAAAEAQMRTVALRQKRNEITDDDALSELETLAVLWRGDSIEAKTLQMLTKLYTSKRRYAEAFAAARASLRLQPNTEASRKTQDEVTALFEQIYNGSRGDEIPPVDALAMFYEYQDLTPIGRQGDEMIRRLADRLVAVDLLDQASELLQYQIERRLDGAARAQVASKLAMIYLMNRKPERAIAALRSTRVADLAGEMRQQRLLLEARAQTDIGRHDLALDIISNIGGREATRLRSDIYWAARRWRESAEQIELLYGDRWRDFRPLSPAEKSDVIRAAIGYALAEDPIGLARFREKYAPRMEGESDKALFDLASKPVAANSADFARIAKAAAAIDTLDGFLREMKMRFPDVIARAKLPPGMKADPNPTGSLPVITGNRAAKASR